MTLIPYRVRAVKNKSAQPFGWRAEYVSLKNVHRSRRIGHLATPSALSIASRSSAARPVHRGRSAPSNTPHS